MRRTSRTVQNSASSSPTSRRRVSPVTGLGRFASAGVFMTVVLSFTTVFGAFAPNAGAATSTGATGVTHVVAHDGGGTGSGSGGGTTTGNGNNGGAGHSGNGSPSGNNGNDKCVGNVINASGGSTPSARSSHGDGQDGTGSDNDGDDSCASFTVTKSASGPTVSSGVQSIDYTITATNNGKNPRSPKILWQKS